MAAQRQAGPSYRRAVLIYLVAIVGPALVLLFLGLQSIRRQREAMAALTASNLRLTGERLAAELERRTNQAAEACLGDGKLLEVPLDFDTPEGSRQIRVQLESIRGRHPVARHLFFLEGNTVRYPLLRTPPPRQLDPHLAREAPDVERRFSLPWAAAEDLELRQQETGLALAAYRQCYELPVSASLKALALARMARCAQKANQHPEAEQDWRLLYERYADLYDLSHRPYGLIAGLELSPSTPQVLKGLHQDLVRGRWELSAEQVDYFLTKLVGSPKDFESEYLAHLKLARALEETFRHQGTLRPGDVHAFAPARAASSFQIYYSLLPPARKGDIVVGLAVDLAWVEKRLLPEAAARSAMGKGSRVELRAADQAIEAPGDVRIAFPTLFPFWRLSLSAPPALQRDLPVFAAVTFSVLGVLILGVVVLLRDVWRDIELTRLRADFVSGVSHELKTPLTLIRLYADTWFHGPDSPPEERRSYYRIIVRETERLTELIEKVLEFSRIGRGRKQYRLEDGDLKPVVEGALEAYSEHLRRRGFTVETGLASHLPRVSFDAGAISQTVLNLLDNAAKYSMDSRFVGVRLWSKEDTVILEVEDRGIGIPAGEQEKIFQQFYRVPGRTARGGYGLGLYLVRHIMEAHRGRVEVESEVGRGSRFRLVFPARPPGAAPAPQGVLAADG